MGSVVPVPGSDLCWGGHASVCLCSYDTPHVFPESELPIESIQLYEVVRISFVLSKFDMLNSGFIYCLGEFFGHIFNL